MRFMTKKQPEAMSLQLFPNVSNWLRLIPIRRADSRERPGRLQGGFDEPHPVGDPKRKDVVVEVVVRVVQ